MGREVRRVPANWEHPTQRCGHSPWAGGCDRAKKNGGQCYQPLYNRDVETAWSEWQAEWQEWLASEFKRVREKYPDDTLGEDEPYRAFCDWRGGPPEPEYYRPKWDEEKATWFQLYETVSEGTPVSPPFETEEELAQYLAEYGDFWHQDSPTDWRTKPTIEQARSLVGTGWASSMIANVSETNIVMMDAYQQQDLKPQPNAQFD